MSPKALRLAVPAEAPGPLRSPHARRCTVRIETDSGTLVGRVYVGHGKGRVSDVLCDERPFLSLTDVTSEGSQLRAEEFVAINKNCIRTLRILDEA